MKSEFPATKKVDRYSVWGCKVLPVGRSLDTMVGKSGG